MNNREIAMLNMEQYSQLKRVLERVGGLHYAIVKGEPLSVLCYNKKSMRESQDIDIIVERGKLSFLEKILYDCGFIMIDQSGKALSRKNRILYLSQSHQIEPYIKEVKNHFVQIDLNFDIFWGEYTGKRIDISELLSDTVEMDIYGVKVKTLPPLKAMIQLVLHHYKDLNSIFLLVTRKSIKYDMFKDVYYLLKNNLDAISLDRLYAMSAEYEIIPYVYYVLYHTGLLFKDEWLDKYIAAFKTPEGEALLNCYGLNEAERREWKCDFQTRLASQNLYHLIRDDLSEKDLEKIAMNKKVFLGE